MDTVLFDLDGTLRHSVPTFHEAYLGFAFQLGARDSKQNRRNAYRWLHYYWAQSPELLHDLEQYVGLDEAFWNNHARQYLLALGCPPQQAEELAPRLSQSMEAGYQPDDMLAEGVIELLSTLKDAGFRLGVVSNRTHPYEEQLANLGLLPFFEIALAAGSVNAWKPDPAIFQHALELMQAKPEQAVYVGDNYFADVIGARRAGMASILIDPEELFPEADCPVIAQVSEVVEVLRQNPMNQERNSSAN